MSHPSHSRVPLEHPATMLAAADRHPAPVAHGHHGGTGWRAAAAVTFHCLSGCLIGEWLGLAIGVAFSLPVRPTVLLATALAYASGFGLTLWPLLRAGIRFWPALTTVFVGEVVSIGVMEIAMNAIDYALGGMGMKSLFVPRYWEALAGAAVAGFLAAWPVNFWLLSRHVKRCH